MHFKISQGFTLIEVMIATAVMALMFASIFALQSSVTRSVIAATQRFERMLDARAFFVEASQEAADSEKESFTSSKKIARPATDLRYTSNKMTAEAPFGKFAHDMYKQQVTITWQDGQNKRQEILVAYRYQPKKAEKPGENKEETKGQAPKQTTNSSTNSEQTNQQLTPESPQPNPGTPVAPQQNSQQATPAETPAAQAGVPQ